MYFDRFDICEAYYVYASLYNIGHGARHPVSGREIWERLDRVKFRPGVCGGTEDSLTENGQEILARLEAATKVRG